MNETSCLQGLQYIHSMGMVHLDIKPENIFLSVPDSSNPVSPLACIAEDSVKDEGPQPLYKIGRNMLYLLSIGHDSCWVFVDQYIGGRTPGNCQTNVCCMNFNGIG